MDHFWHETLHLLSEAPDIVGQREPVSAVPCPNSCPTDSLSMINGFL